MISAAAERLAELDNLPGRDLVARVEATLNALVAVMNEETTLLRAGPSTCVAVGNRRRNSSSRSGPTRTRAMVVPSAVSSRSMTSL